MARELNRLTVLEIKNAQPSATPNTPRLIAEGGGLYLQVTPQGSKSFLFRYTYEGKPQTVAKGLTSQSVALVVMRSMKRVHGAADTKTVSGRSLRAGYCTEAALFGMAPWQIRERTGHESDVTLAEYIWPVSKRKVSSLL
jgi:hypothetical protein